MYSSIRRFILVGLIALLIVGIPGFGTRATAQTTSVSASQLESDFAVEWMSTLYDRVKAGTVNVPMAARLYAYAGVTLYQAVQPGIDGSRPLTGMLNGLESVPVPDPTLAYDWISVANGAMVRVLRELTVQGVDVALTNTANVNGTRRAIEAIYERQVSARLRTLDPEIVNRSLDYGDQVGRSILTWAEQDNFLVTREMTYGLSTGHDALWRPLRAGQQPMEPFWGMIRSMVMANADECAIPLDVEFDTKIGSPFYMQAMEVRDISLALTDDQKQIARMWDEAPGITATHSGHWGWIVGQLVAELDLKLDRAADAYARVGIALNDAFISTWSLKYQVNLARPEQYIRSFIDPHWRPFRATPPFPSYPSGHSVVGAAVAEVLTNTFGPMYFINRHGIQYDILERSYTSFYALSYENAISRVYGGVHYRFDIENGMEQGQCVGWEVNTRLKSLTAVAN